jgi:hypothetical protein
VFTITAPVVASVETSRVYGSRTILNKDIRYLLSVKSFVFSGDLLYREIIARPENTQFIGIEYGIYPFKIQIQQGTTDTVLIQGTLEVKEYNENSTN